jgi:starch synthase
MRAQLYGAPPIVRHVGGLADTVEDGVTGFAFKPYTTDAFQEATFRALDCFSHPSKWGTVMREGMARDFSWERSVATYLDVYRRAIAQR